MMPSPPARASADPAAALLPRLASVLVPGALGIQVMTLLGIWGRWSRMGVLVGLAALITATNMLLTMRLRARFGLRSTEVARQAANVAYACLVGHLTSWTFPVWFWLPYWALAFDGLIDPRAKLRLGLNLAVTSLVGVIDGVSPWVPACFCALAGIAYTASNARELSLGVALHDAEEKKHQLATLNAELRDLPRRIQTSILPNDVQIEGLEIAACMITAEEVGGDYYDILPAERGSWIGIGDVAGHGLPAGLIMLMVQSAVFSLTSANPHAGPGEIVALLNRVLYENVRRRLHRNDHVTLSLLRQHADGRVEFAGAHEEMVVWRARTGACESVETLGTWLAARPEIEAVTCTSSIHLEDGDVLILYTDGITEARNPAGELFGDARLHRIVEAAGAESPDAIRDRIMESVRLWSELVEDDRTVVVVRYRAPTGRTPSAPRTSPAVEASRSR